MSTGFFSWENECARLRVALAAAQATNAKLREALQDIRSHATPIGCRLASKALRFLAAVAEKASPISEEAMDILRAENEKLKTEVEEFAVLVSRLSLKLKKVAPDSDLPGKATDYLRRTGRQGSPLRKVCAGDTAVHGPIHR